MRMEETWKKRDSELFGEVGIPSSVKTSDIKPQKTEVMLFLNDHVCTGQQELFVSESPSSLLQDYLGMLGRPGRKMSKHQIGICVLWMEI